MPLSTQPSGRCPLTRALALWLLVSLAASRPVAAGPTRYDPATRSFNINYTYAALPYFGMPPDQIQQLGQLQKPTTEQDAQVRALYQAVSQILEEVTDGRAKIGKFECVDEIKNADVIISLTGVFERAGWATPGRIEGQPGQIGLYYQYLEQRSKQEIALTVGHELSHYLFALPDEYSQAPQAECPLQNPDSPGCLMDNYFVRHGFRRLCNDSDHNPDGPRQNPGTIFQGHRAEDSCQLWVDNFFKAHPPGAATDSGSTTTGDSEATGLDSGGATVQPSEPFTGAFRQLINSATLFVRDRIKQDEADRAKRKLPRQNPQRFQLQTLARNFLNKQITELGGDPDFVAPTRDQLEQAIGMVAENVLATNKLKTPARFNKETVARLRTKARELAAVATGPGMAAGGTSALLKLLFGEQGPPKLEQLKPIIAKVARGLAEFALSQGMKALIGFAPPTAAQMQEERAFLDQLATEAVAGPGGTTEFGTFLEAARLHIRLSLNTAETLNAIANELDLPGAEQRKVSLQDLSTRLEKFRLPGRPFAGLGTRRTYIIAPLPVDPEFDRVRIDAGDNFSYREIRNLVVGEFIRLIQRERIEFIEGVRGGNPGPASAPGEEAGPLRTADRFAAQVALINKLEDEVRRNRVENIIILAPPDGLSISLDDALEALRQRVLRDNDVRVDVILSGRGTISLRLRDLVARTGGTVQLATDLDEVAAVAHRLKNELVSGSLVRPPQPGYIDFSYNRRADFRAAADLRPQARVEVLSPRDLQRRYKSAPGERRRERAAGRDPFWRPHLDQGKLDPALDITVNEIESFNKKLDVCVNDFVRTRAQPPSYNRVANALSGLYALQIHIEDIGRELERLAERPVDHSAHQILHKLIDDVFATKQSLRPLFGSRTLMASSLTSTDDYFDWNLRRLLVQEAILLRTEYVDAERAVISPRLRQRILSKAAYLWQRASIRDQALADLTEAEFAAEMALNNLAGREPGEDANRALENANAELRQIRQALVRAQREEAARAPDESSLMLHAADDLQHLIEPRLKRNDRENDPPLDGPWFRYTVYLVKRTAQHLERASEQPIDPVRFGNAVDKLRDQFDQLRVLTDQHRDIADLDRTALESLNDLVDLLSQRSERLIGRPAVGATDAPIGVTGLKSNLESEEDVPSRDNALAGLMEALKPDDELTASLAGDRERLKRWLSLDPDNTPEEIRERIENLVHADFPLLMLDVLGRLRGLEDHLRAIEENFHDEQRPRPAFERLVRKRFAARPDLNADRTGQLIEIPFEPFLAEDQAEFELVIGLSRPLRAFEELREDPPVLRLRKGDANGNLVERPYLRFDPDLSTETLLVYRVPTPRMRAGLLGPGTYAPSLLINRKHLPILTRNNTVNFTFTIATPRPNVQLIAALRQTQPKESDRDLEKDKEFAFRGTLAANAQEAIVEVQVLAGASVTNSQVTGIFQRFDNNADLIESPALDFVDDGLFPDLTKDDGIYTARITLKPSALREPAEYRVFIEARSTGKDAFIPLREEIPSQDSTENKSGKGNDQKPPDVPPYQRATSLDFHVSGES